MRLSKPWVNYQILDAGNQEKLEQVGDFLIVRPDPLAPFKKEKPELWYQADAIFKLDTQNKGQWHFKTPLKDPIILRYNQFQFISNLGIFKHIGIFPEQATNWDWMLKTISESKKNQLKVLNLFAYTGGATTVAASSYQVSEVVHVDAAKKMVGWAKDNLALNQLTHKKVRFMVDDVTKFVKREIKRQRRYDIIILDPPSYGRGPNNQLWKIETHLPPLLEDLNQLLSDEPLFVLLNSYSTHISKTMIHDMMASTLWSGNSQVDAIGLNIEASKQVLPAGVSGLWTP